MMLIVQFCEHGALNSYLKRCKDAGDALRFKEKTKFCYEIAEGMAYLNNCGLVHRDLAARNVLLDSHLQCKIAE